MKTLGISIPTYKRPDYLRRCVISAVDSAQGKPIEIFIADDSVSETNAAVYSELQAKYPFVQVHRNPKNLGIDINIQRCVDLNHCDFIWIIGEDDTFLPGAVSRIHERIQSLSEPFLLVNYTFVGNDPDLPFDNALRDRPQGAFAASDFFRGYLWAAGFLGGCVINREAWRSTSPAPYAGTYYTHVGRIAEAVAKFGSAQVMTECGVANRVRGGNDNFTWKDDSYGVFFSFLTMCRIVGMRVPQFAPDLEAGGMALEQRYRWLSFQVAMRLRSQGAFDKGQFHSYIAPTEMNPFKKAGFFLISVAPCSIFRPLVRFYRALRGNA